MDSTNKSNGKVRTFLRTERDKLRPMTWNQRFSYLWEYYKFPAMLTAFVLFFVIWIAVAMISGLSQDPRLYCYLSTGTEDPCTEWFDEYEQSRGYGKHELVKVTSGRYASENAALYGTGYTFNMSYAADLTAHTIDTIICDQYTLDYLLQTETLDDLSTTLNGTAAEMASDDLVWCEFDAENAQEGEIAYTPGYYALDISDTALGRQIDCGNGVYFTVIHIDERLDEVQAFLEYILAQK